MRWLTAIAIGIDFVVRPNWNIEFFFIVSVEVSEIHGERSVRIGPPAFVNRNDVLPTAILTLIRKLRARNAHGKRNDCNREEQSRA